MLKVHARENNSASQTFLDFNRPRLSKQCDKVLALLQSGKRLTVRGAMIEHDIGHLPRRIADLKENGIAVRDDWKDGVKEYYL